MARSLMGCYAVDLWDPYNDYHMGNIAEKCAVKYNVTREQQDAYAIESYKRAAKAYDENAFAEEIVPVEISQKKGGSVCGEP